MSCKNLVLTQYARPCFFDKFIHKQKPQKVLNRIYFGLCLWVLSELTWAFKIKQVLVKTRLKVFNPRPRVELSHFISNFQKNF